MAKVTELGRDSELGSGFSTSDSNPEQPRPEVGRMAPPGLPLGAGASSDKERSREEGPGTKKI